MAGIAQVPLRGGVDPSGDALTRLLLVTDLFDSAQPGASARREADRAAAARLRRGDPLEPPSEWETRFRQGGEGEAYLGGRLNEEAQRRGGIGVLHDLVLPGRKANIDHVVVGPAGVMIIDAKAWSGHVWVGRDVIGQGRRGRRKPLEGMSRQLHRVQTALAAAGRDDVTVEPMLCFVKGNRGLSSRQLDEVGGVLVGTVEPVIDHAIRPGPLGPHDVREIYELLASSFVVQGGAVAPTTGEFLSIAAAAPATRRGRPGIRRTRRPRRRSSARTRSRRALRHAVAEIAFLAVGCALLVGIINSALSVVPVATPKLSRQQLEHQLPRIRTRARAFAHGPIRRVGTVTHRDRFVVRFRRGRRCVVAVTVRRDVVAPVAHARVSGTRCGRRPTGTA